MHWCVLRPLAATSLAWSLAFGAHAQAHPSLRDAVEAAWSLNPQARALASRQAELDARARAASSLISGPPSLALSHRSDRPATNAGLREYEAEVTAPLWNPGVRRATVDQVEADRAAFLQQQALAKIKVAAEVRDLAAEATLAQVERDLAQSKLREAQLLAADVERRVKAGESARVDLLQARSLQQQAAAALAQSEGMLAKAAAQWRALTGLSQLPVLDANIVEAQEHPAMAAAQAQMRAARARLSLLQADVRDPLEVGVGVTRERAAAGAPTENSLRLSVRIPLGSYGRNAPRLAAAQAEVDQAEAEAAAAERSIGAERDGALAQLEAARRAEQLAAERATSSREVQELIAKSYRLGESDLPTRLRTESERFEADLAHARARLETRRATARLNQANGILP